MFPGSCVIHWAEMHCMWYLCCVDVLHINMVHSNNCGSLLVVLVLVYGQIHYTDAIMGAMASQITSLIIVNSTAYSGADQRKHRSSASLAFVRWPVNSPHKWPVTRKMFPLDDVIMYADNYVNLLRGTGYATRYRCSPGFRHWHRGNDSCVQCHRGNPADYW